MADDPREENAQTAVLSLEACDTVESACRMLKYGLYVGPVIGSLCHEIIGGDGAAEDNRCIEDSQPSQRPPVEIDRQFLGEPQREDLLS